MQINNCFSQIIGHQHSKWPNNKILIFFLRCLALLYFVFSLTSFPSLILLVIVFFDEKSRQLGHYTSDTTLLYGYPSFSSSLNNKLFHLHSQVRRRQLYSLVPDYTLYGSSFHHWFDHLYFQFQAHARFSLYYFSFHIISNASL